MTETMTPPVADDTTTPPADPVPVADNGTVNGPPQYKKSAVIDLFVGLGYPTAKDWSLAKFGKNITSLPQKAEDPLFVDFVNKLEPAMKDLYDALYSAAVNKTEIDLVDGETTPKAKKEKKTAAPKAAKKTRAGGPPARDNTLERDAFGSAKGTRGYDAMKVIVRDTPKKVADIVKESGHGEDKFVGVFYNFLNAQVTKGFLKKSDKGYQFTAAGEKHKEKFEAAKNAPQEATTPEAAVTPA